MVDYENLPVLNGAWGAMVQQHLEGIYVSRAEMTAFLESPVPRTVPKALSCRVLNTRLRYLTIGTIFLCFGICLITAIASVNGGTIREQDGSLAGFIFLCCWTLFFTAMIAFTLIYRRRKMRLLSEGILTFGTITKVTSSAIPSTSGMPGYLTVEYPAASGTRTVTYEADPDTETIARQLMDQKQHVRMLIDPLDSKHFICPELFTPLDEVLQKAADSLRRPYKYRL